MAKKFEVTLKRSLIGCTDSQIATATALGLRKVSKKVTVNDTPANRGQILKLQHLVDVQVVK